MAHVDFLPRSGIVAQTLHRIVRSVALPRSGGVAPAADDDCRFRLDSRTTHDIGACPAYRDYASSLTLGAGTQPGLHRLAEAARWDVLR